MKLDSISEVLDDIRAGKPVVIVDDRDREHEGDLMLAAELVTPESINFMIIHGKGLICLTLTEERLKELQIPMQVSENTSPFGTNFAMSFDYRLVSEEGMTAKARASTILHAVSDVAKAEDFIIPGYVYPLAAVPGGVLKRRGQTEGSHDLARMAGLKPAGVICEIMAADGTMLRDQGLIEYCQTHQLKITSVDAIANYRLHHEVSLRRVAECSIDQVPLLHLGNENHQSFQSKRIESLRVLVYVDDTDDKEHLAFIKGNPRDGCLVRIHSECLTGDVFQSRRCDCGYQFNQALSLICEAECGIVIYLHQEGRGIGLGNKLRAYELQDQGFDTVDANLELGFSPDSRDYRAAAQILSDLGINKIRLLTNNPAKVISLEDFGILVPERVPHAATPNTHNASYLRAKRERMGHLIP